MITLFICLLLKSILGNNSNSGDAIIGKWETLQDNLIVEVYKYKNEYRGKIVWALEKNSKIEGVNNNEANHTYAYSGKEILQELVYDHKKQSWTGGKIFDHKSNKTWNSQACITPEGLLKLRGYAHFEIIGKTVYFKRLL
ncbi:MAG: DUF2147 domain-containing protein [Flavisolibacter sp.]